MAIKKKFNALKADNRMRGHRTRLTKGNLGWKNKNAINLDATNLF